MPCRGMYIYGIKGPFIFYEVGGAGGIWGGHAKKYGFNGGVSQKNMVFKGGLTKNMAFKFSSDSVCNNANNSARRPKIAFLRFWKFNFSQGRMPPDPPTLLYTQRQLYSTNCFIRKYSQGNVNSFLASADLILKQLITVSKIMLSTGMNCLFMYFRISIYFCRTWVLTDWLFNLSFISFRFTLSLLLVFTFFWGGVISNI